MRSFEHLYVVADVDIDELGHANNIAYVRWVQDVAVAHSRAVGLDWDTYRRLGCCFVVRRHEIDYLQPVGAGETLKVRTWISDWKAASCLRHTEVKRASDGAPVARGVTRWALVDLATGRPRRITQELGAAFGVDISASDQTENPPLTGVQR
jgi:acyl-CoA thioester hydrolase